MAKCANTGCLSEGVHPIPVCDHLRWMTGNAGQFAAAWRGCGMHSRPGGQSSARAEGMTLQGNNQKAWMREPGNVRADLEGPHSPCFLAEGSGARRYAPPRRPAGCPPPTTGGWKVAVAQSSRTAGGNRRARSEATSSHPCWARYSTEVGRNRPLPPKKIDQAKPRSRLQSANV
jgi:hypothetical protein